LGRRYPEAQGEHGPAIGAETGRRITCDAPVVAMVQNARGERLAIGRKSRRVSMALYRALRSRDRTCVHPYYPLTFTPWSRGGYHRLDGQPRHLAWVGVWHA